MTLPLQSAKEQWHQQRRTAQANRRSDHNSSQQDESQDKSLDKTQTESKEQNNMDTDARNPEIDGTKSKTNTSTIESMNNASGPNQENKTQETNKHVKEDDNHASSQEGKAI
jgi:hypothetical protein